MICYDVGVENKFKPALALFSAAVLYGLYGIYARLVGFEFGVFTQSWVRYLISAILVGIFLLFKNQKFSFTKKDILWLGAWVLSDAISELLIFTSFNKISLGVAYFMLYVGIIFSGYFFGYILYKEKFTTIKILAAGLSIFGMALIFNTSWHSENPLYIILALVSGVACGFWYTSTAKLTKFTNWQLIFINSLSIFFITSLGAIVFQEPFPKLGINFSWWGIICYVVSYLIAAKFIIYGFQKMDSHLGNLIMPIEIVFGALFGFIFFNQTLPTIAWLGGGLIFLAAILPNIISDNYEFKKI